ncbi:GNAT family N-acetyltransferase [Amycolatopsis nigrescens]|uniref:GNAT family N-acetyltransferase n=1 Tax=Amycolatopsis nigrescens TaxID=381445 RepID=UPI0003829D5F|nr:GNAT family N-acetyltransferase [Amycolatopsis nigrescens]
MVNMVAVKVRRAVPGDGDGCSRVWRDTGRYLAELNPDLSQVPDCSELADKFDALCSALGGQPDQLFLVALRDREIVGMLIARLLEPAENASLQLERDLGRRRVQVDALAVSAGQRRDGAGTALMESVLGWARECGAEVMLLETEANNELSVPFYRDRLGFSARLVKFRKELR